MGWERWSSRRREGCVSLQASLWVSSVAESLQGTRSHGSRVKGIGPPPGPYPPAQRSELLGGRDLPHWMVVATCGENGDSVSLCMRLPVLNKSNKLDVNIHHLSGSCPPSLSTGGWARSMEGDLCAPPSLSQLPFPHSPPQSGSPFSFPDWSEFPPGVRRGGQLCCQLGQKAGAQLPPCLPAALTWRSAAHRAGQPWGLSPAFFPPLPAPLLSWLVKFSEWAGALNPELTLRAPAVVSFSRT